MQSSPVSPARQKKVLVVEDDEEVRTLLQKSLGEKYEVLLAQNAGQALHMGRKFHPDLFLLDVMLPGVDGFEVAKRLRGEESLKRVPVIFLTARVTAQDTVKGIQAGAKHYITKPFNLVDLREKVARVLG